jgi:hypothetical protein
MPVSVSGYPSRVVASAALCLGLISAGAGGDSFASRAEAAAKTNVCALLSLGELRPVWGKEMTTRPAAELPQADGCDWVAVDHRGGLLTVRIIPKNYYEEPSLARGFKMLPGVGDKAWVVPELGGWRAAAMKGAKVAVIQVDGGTSNQDKTVALLKKIVGKI